MGDYEGDRGRVGAGNVSRQFTESELAIDERATEHLTQRVDEMPAPLLSKHGNGISSYAWLKEDLEDRDKATVRLTREMGLANAQSERRQLSDDAVLESQQKNQALEAIDFVSRWNEKGFGSPQLAKEDYYRETPGAAGNPHVNRGMQAVIGGTETEIQRQARLAGEKATLAENMNRNSGAAAKLAWDKAHPGALDEVFALEAQNQKDAAEIQAALNARAFEESRIIREEWGNLDEDGQKAYTSTVGLFNEVSMDVLDPTPVIKAYGADSMVVRMITNRKFLTDLDKTPSQKATLTAALNTFSDPEATDKDRLQAKKDIAIAANGFEKQHEQHLRVEANNKEINSFSTKFAERRKSTETKNDGLYNNIVHADANYESGVANLQGMLENTRIQIDFTAEEFGLAGTAAAKAAFDEIQRMHDKVITNFETYSNYTSEDQKKKAVSNFQKDAGLYLQSINKTMGKFYSDALKAKRASVLEPEEDEPTAGVPSGPAPSPAPRYEEGVVASSFGGMLDRAKADGISYSEAIGDKTWDEIFDTIGTSPEFDKALSDRGIDPVEFRADPSKF